MVFENLCIPALETKVALTLEELIYRVKGYYEGRMQCLPLLMVAHEARTYQHSGRVVDLVIRPPH